MAGQVNPHPNPPPLRGRGSHGASDSLSRAAGEDGAHAERGRVGVQPLHSSLPTHLLFPLLSLLLAALIGFTLCWHAPGGPAIGLYGQDLAPGQAEETLRRLGLDRPFPEAFAAWLARALTGDLGISWRSGAPVATILAERLPVTLALTIPAALLAALAGVLGGVIASAVRARWPAAAFAALHAIPSYVTAGALVAIFALTLGWLPVGGLSDPRAAAPHALDIARHLVLPVAALATHQSAFLALVLRAGIAAEMARPYSLAARARGRSDWGARWHHAMPNAALPAITLFATRIGAALGGAVTVETAFALPGLGRLAVTAALARDHPVVLGCLLLATAAVILANLLADAVVATLDPRLRRGGA